MLYIAYYNIDRSIGIITCSSPDRFLACTSWSATFSGEFPAKYVHFHITGYSETDMEKAQLDVDNCYEVAIRVAKAAGKVGNRLVFVHGTGGICIVGISIVNVNCVTQSNLLSLFLLL